MYLYDLSYSDRTNLCRVLDACNKWEELGILHMQYDKWTVQDLHNEKSRGRSPTDSLLMMWGHQNHTVLELFVLLNRMKHYQAMSVIKHLIDKKYHHLIPEEINTCDMNMDRGSDKKLLSRKIINGESNVTESKSMPPIIIESNENNESAPAANNVNALLPKLAADLKITSNVNTKTSTFGDILQIKYEELQKATNNWSSEFILGKGGFGTVFKGNWKCTYVAIKRIDKRDSQPNGYIEELRQSMTELKCLYTVRHDNILSLYGYSLGGPHNCLVYQYMLGGCLDKRLRVKDPSKVLSWPMRLNIAIGSARGLQYLHTISEKPLIHGDIKSANILLDANDQPRIGDFGLAREGPQAEYMKISRIQGTKPYLPEEFWRAGKFSTKVDTYSFGVVLFEIGTSLTAYTEKRSEDNKLLKDYIVNYKTEDLHQLKDSRAPEGEEAYAGLMAIGKVCVSVRPKDRPEMVQVLIDLENVPVS